MAIDDPDGLRAALTAPTGSAPWWPRAAAAHVGGPSASTSTTSRPRHASSSSRRSWARFGPRARARPGRAPPRRTRDPDAALIEGSYADAVLAGAPDPELVAMARDAVRNAYAPYSHFPVGAAMRTTDGRRYAGANVENAAYPQGQCAEASAIGAIVAGGGGRSPRSSWPRRAGALHAVRRLPPAAARVHPARRADPPRRRRARPAHHVARRAAAAVVRPGAPGPMTAAAHEIAERAPGSTRGTG